MNLRSPFLPTLLALSFISTGPLRAQSANGSQNVMLTEKLKIPGATLNPGEYTFSVEDRLQDRAIVRIATGDGTKHFLLLSVPSTQLGKPDADGLIRFTAPSSEGQTLRGWACTACSPVLEFVYPNTEAAKLTDDSGENILAYDPTYDKLPKNLSPDDMKVVTLWLLSPERITANNKAKGVKAEKYTGSLVIAARTPAAVTNSPDLTFAAPSVGRTKATESTADTPNPAVSGGTSEVAQAPAHSEAPASHSVSEQSTDANAPVAQSDTAVHSNGHLPKTASNDHWYIFGGLILMLAAAGVRLSRRFSRVGL